MVLGATTTGISPYELAGAYMMYGDGGRMTTPHSYTSVRDYQGNEILEKDIVTTSGHWRGHRVYHEPSAAQRFVRPAARRAASGQDANVMETIGKTGTTNDNKDVWFVGLTPKYVMATWYGYDENEPMDDYNNYYIYKNKGSQKGHPGASAFAEVMNTVQADDENRIEWDMPETWRWRRSAPSRDDIPTDGCPRHWLLQKRRISTRCMYGHPCNRSRRLATRTIDKHHRARGLSGGWAEENLIALHEIHFARARCAKKCVFRRCSQAILCKPEKTCARPAAVLVPGGKHVIVSLSKNICASVAYMEKG
ncbi:MAG: hypothetical protein V8T36_08195 [Ruthenibacterium lactatiformans]